MRAAFLFFLVFSSVSYGVFKFTPRGIIGCADAIVMETGTKYQVILYNPATNSGGVRTGRHVTRIVTSSDRYEETPCYKLEMTYDLGQPDESTVTNYHAKNGTFYVTQFGQKFMTEGKQGTRSAPPPEQTPLASFTTPDGVTHKDLLQGTANKERSQLITIRSRKTQQVIYMESFENGDRNLWTMKFYVSAIEPRR